MKKYKEIAVKAKYIVVLYDNNAVEVYVKQKVTIAILHKIAGENGLKFHQDTAVENGIEWFAKKILDTVGDPNAIVGGEDCLYINKNNTLICGHRYEGTVKEALRKIAEEFEIDYQDTWNTQQFGRKIINELK